MGNCLVTKLKSNVDNPNLNYYGAISIDLCDTTSLITLVKIPTAEIKLKAVGGTINVANGATHETLVSNVTDYTLPVKSVEISTSTSAKVFIMSKYDGIKLLNTGGNCEIDLDTFAYVKDLLETTIFGAKGTLDVNTIQWFNDTNALTIVDTFRRPNIILPSSLKYNFTRFVVFGANKVVGNIENMATMGSTMVRFAIGNLVDGSGVTGSINTFLDTIYAGGEGRTSGSMNVELIGTACTYNGATVETNLTVTFSANGWTAVPFN